MALRNQKISTHLNYKINPATHLHWASWNDEYVIFDEGSGQTHQMDSVRAFLVNCLCEEMHSSDSLAAELANVPVLAKNPNTLELVETILSELCVHGLVEVTNA